MSKSVFWGVASGAISKTSGLFWTRYGEAPSADYAPPTDAVPLQLELSRRADFSTVERIVATSTRPDHDGTAKVIIEGLTPNSTWYYRFRTGVQISATGRYRTSPEANDPYTTLNLGFGGCANGRYAPYLVIDSLGKADFDLDLFVMLGDAAYGNKINYPDPIGTIPENPNPIKSRGDLDGLRQAVWTKMLLNLASVRTDDPNQPETVPGSLAPLYANQAVIALPDNKDLGDNFLEAGGAPLAFLQGVIDGNITDEDGNQVTVADDAEGTSLSNYFSTLRYYLEQGKTPEYVNQSPEYQALAQSFLDYLPVPDGTLAPFDQNGTLKPLYGTTEWGRNARIITLDDRTYRDIKILDGNNSKADDDTTISKVGADARDRTILGSEQLAWFKQELLKAKADGVLWTIVNVSSPVDATGAPGQDGEAIFGQTSVDAKSFWGNYRWERNEILRFIAEHDIRNVVFLSSDDHEFRVNELVYAPNPDTASDNGEGLTNNLAVVPGVFTAVASPLGAARPEGFLGTNPGEPNSRVANFSTPTTYTGRGKPAPTQTFTDGFVGQAEALRKNMENQGVDPIGLSAEFAGLRSLSRSIELFDDNPVYKADVNTPQIQDFWSPQTYNWGQLQIDPQGQLTVSAWGMNAYSYDQTVDFNRPTAPVDQLLSFTLAPSIAWKGPVERDGDTGLRFMDGQNLTFWRSDQGSRRVSFGLATPEGAPTWFLKDALGGSPGSLTPEAAVNPDPSSGWLASEGKRVGGLATVFDLPIGGSTWTPVASRDGQVLQLQSVRVEGNRITAQFEDGITGIIGLPGTGTAAAPADTQPLVTVQRLAAWGNGLALYEADPITGAVGGLRPGDPGYLDAALAQAETSGRVVNALQLPAYGTTGSLNGLNLDPSRSYGVLLLVQGDRNRLLCSYAAANPGGAAQMLSLGSDGRGIVIGIEDQQIFGGTSDGDFNDLILRVDAAVVRLV